MAESVKAKEIRSAVMDRFRKWGGQWNVTVAPTEDGSAWQLVVHSRHVSSARLSEAAAASLLKGEGEAEGAWAAELRPLFRAALDASHEH